MSRTERTRLKWTFGKGYKLDRDCRDDGCDHYECHGWKRPERRKARRDAKAALRRNPEEAR